MKSVGCPVSTVSVPIKMRARARARARVCVCVWAYVCECVLLGSTRMIHLLAKDESNITNLNGYY